MSIAEEHSRNALEGCGHAAAAHLREQLHVHRYRELVEVVSSAVFTEGHSRD